MTVRSLIHRACCLVSLATAVACSDDAAAPANSSSEGSEQPTNSQGQSGSGDDPQGTPDPPSGDDTNPTDEPPVGVGVGALLWEDNFDSLNTDIWTKDVGDGCNVGLCGWGNQELQSYQESNVSIEDIPGEAGNRALRLQARKETAGSSSFTSGKITSQHKLAVQYGLIEFRMRVPNLESGLWPAVWMLGTSTLPWPNKGEIDMMEMGHDSAERERQGESGATTNSYVGSNLIFYSEAACVPENPTCAASTAWDVNSDKPYVAASGMNDRFVIYRTYWTSSSIRFTVVDGDTEYDLYETPFSITEESSAFTQPFYLLMNLAVGGSFTGLLEASDITAPLPADMYVDYIRVYKLDGQGSVILGNVLPAESGSFGVFTDTTATENALVTGVDSDIYLWDSFSSAGSEGPFEGDNVISYDYSPGTWFGAGIVSRQARDLSAFADGYLNFRIKIPADVGFRIGITDTYGNENWVTFSQGSSKYGLTRNGQWGQAKVPVSELRGALVALQSLQYVFAISQDPADEPNTAFSYAVDDVFWTAE